jgi:hypothetical protein
MTVPRLTLRNVELRSVSVPIKRPIVSKVGLFDRWPLILIGPEQLKSGSQLTPAGGRWIRTIGPRLR